MPQKFLASTSTTTGLDVWPWAELWPTGFGTVFSAPASALTNYSTGSYAPRFNSAGTSLLCVTQGTPFVQGYQFSPSGYGTKYSNPSVLPTTPTGLSFADDSEFFLSSSTGSFLYSYSFNSTTGYGTRYVAASAQSANSVTTRGSVAFFSHAGTPFISMYPRANPGYGTKYANPGTLPAAPTTAANARSSLLGVSDTDIAISQAGTPYYAVYGWTAASGFGTKYTTPFLGGITAGLSVAFNKTGTAIGVGGSSGGASGYFKVAPWTTGTGPGTAYSNPISLASFYVCGIVFDTNSIAVSMQSTAFLSAWEFNTTTGFGNKYTNSSGGNGGYSIGLGSIPTAISMTASVGSFALSGQSVGLKVGRVVTATAQSFALTSVAATLTKSTVYKIVATSGSYGETGQSVNMLLTPSATTSYTMTASAASFVETGQAAGLRVARKTTAEQGTFSLTGIAAGLKAGRVITATTQSFALTGIATGLKATRTITGAVRSFALTGIDNRLATTRTITASAATFALTGYDANLVKTTAKTLFAATGHFVLTGIANQFLRSYVVSSSAGTFLLAGQSTRLATTRALTATIGPFTLTGVAASLTTQRLVVCAKGTFTLTGNNAILLRTTAAQAGSFSLVGYPAVLRVGRSIAAARGTFSLVGSAAALIRNFNLLVSSRSFALTGIAAATTTSRKVAPDSGSFTESGKTIGLYYGRVALGATGQFLLTGIPVALGELRGIRAETAQFIWSGFESVLIGPLPPVIRSIVLGEATIAPITTSEIVVSSTSGLGSDGSCYDYTSLYSEAP